MIFPVAYWDVIRRHAVENKLDPYLMAALVAQESTFVPDIRSHANAYGLMQLLPSTARQTALKAWETRRRKQQEQKRSAAALKAWETRKANERKRK